MAHLEDPALTADLTVARDFDLGMTGPPLSYSMDFIAGGLVGMIGGLASAVVLFGFAWWAPLVLGGAWLATHWLLRESAVWRDRNTDEVRSAQRDADYAYRLAVDPPASKELRLFGLVGWTIERFVARRTRLHQLQYEATRLRERPLVWSLLIVTAANVVVFWSLASAAAAAASTLATSWSTRNARSGTSLIAFGGLNWALDGASAPVAAVRRLEPAMAAAGAACRPDERPAAGLPAREIRFRNVTFAYPGGAAVLDGFDLTIPAGSSLAIVGQNGAGKTTLAKLLCRLYDPQGGAIEVDGIDLRDLDLDGVAIASDRGVPGLRPLRTAAARQRRARRSARRCRARSARRGRRGEPGAPRHHPGARLRRRHRSVGRPVAARRAGARALRGADGRGRRPARRADGAARRARRSGDLRAASWPQRGTARPSSSLIAFRPSARPIGSACSRRARSSSSARTTS